MKTQKTPSEFDRMMKQATDLMLKAMELKEADSIWVNIQGGKPKVELYWSEREQEGELQSDGTFKFRPKP